MFELWLTVSQSKQLVGTFLQLQTQGPASSMTTPVLSLCLTGKWTFTKNQLTIERFSDNSMLFGPHSCRDGKLIYLSEVSR